MELGSKVIVSCKDRHGAGLRLAHALRQSPSTSWKRTELPLDLPLDSYGLVDVTLSGQIVNFVDSEGSPQVSLILLQNYKAPTSACVAYEVLKFIKTKASTQSLSFTVIFPSFTVIPKSLQNLRCLQLEDMEQSLYAAEINEGSGFSKAIIRGLKRLPPTTHISDDLLASFLHFVHVLKVPAVLLLAPTTQNSRLDSKGTRMQQVEDSQMLCKLGDLLASHMELIFSKELLENQNTPIEIEKNVEDDWRRLYG